MNLKRWIVAVMLSPALLLPGGCTRELPGPTPSPAVYAGESAPVAASAERQEHCSYIPGAALVYVGEALADQLGDGLSGEALKVKSEAEFGYMVSRLGATSFTRLFPDAGEYEPRTRREGLHRWFVVEFDRSVAVTDAIPFLEAVPGIQLAEPNYVLKQAVDINDTYWNQMWGQNNISFPDYDVNCKPVWDSYTMGNPSVVVAVIDGGFQLDHPDLSYNVAASGHYNYVRRNTTISQHFHGTHVAGTIGAVNNNGKGVTGIAGGNALSGKKGVTLLSLQVFETQSNGQDLSAGNFATALKEAADKGAHISQNSWGYNFDFNDDGSVTGSELNYARSAHENPERSFTQAVDYFNKYAGCDNDGNQLPGSPMKGGIVIFAAGNDDIPYGAPGNYDGCVSVGAMNKNGTRASFSNYGDWVDICAPGVNIPSTYINSQYINMSGTSMACPHVSGVAALITSYFGGPGFTSDELRARLLGGAKQIAASTGSKPIGPLVDAWAAFNVNSGSSAPSPITQLSAVPMGHNIRVDFEATDAYAYQVLASTRKSALQDADYQNPASDIVSAIKLAAATDVEGTPLAVTLGGLKPSTDYYVAVAAYSFDKKYAPLSSIVEVHTSENLRPEIQISDYPEGGYEFRHHQIVNIPVSFSDPDGDALTVSFDARGSRATLESNNGAQDLYNFKLMCPLVINSGSFSGVIRVVDEVGAVSVQTIQFKVLPNSEPRVKENPPVMLVDVLNGEKTVQMSDIFEDPDEEPLMFRATSLDKNVASAEVSEDGIVTVKALSEGLCQVKLSAEDHNNERAETILTVLVRLPGTGEVSFTGDTVISGSGSLTIIPGIEPDSATVRVISASGVVVYESVCTISAANPLELELDNLAPGIYTVEVTYKGQVYTYTIVKR